MFYIIFAIKIIFKPEKVRKIRSENFCKGKRVFFRENKRVLGGGGGRREFIEN
jgi:hypothetical protein